MNTKLTIAEFDRLFNEAAEAHGWAVHGEYATPEERDEAMEKAVVARMLLQRAVFGEEIDK